MDLGKELTPEVSERQAGRWKGGRYDTTKPEDAQAWNELRKLVGATSNDNQEVKARLTKLAELVNSGELKIVRK